MVSTVPLGQWVLRVRWVPLVHKVPRVREARKVPSGRQGLKDLLALAAQRHR